MTAFPVKPLRKGLGLMGMNAVVILKGFLFFGVNSQKFRPVCKQAGNVFVAKGSIKLKLYDTQRDLLYKMLKVRKKS